MNHFVNAIQRGMAKAVPHLSEARQLKKLIKRYYKDTIGIKMSGRQWVKLRKAMNRGNKNLHQS